MGAPTVAVASGRSAVVWWWLGAVALVAGSAAGAEPPDPGAAGLPPGQRLAMLVARSAYEQARIETLEADFVQRKESILLLEPEHSAGSFSYRSPDSLRWDYVSPSAVTVVLSDQEMITWYRDSDRVERLDLGRRADRILKLLGPGASLAELERYFTLRATFPAATGEPYRLQLEPRQRRIERRIREVGLELDPELFIPSFVRLVDAEGGVTEIRFDAIRVNGEVPADRFEIALQSSVN